MRLTAICTYDSKQIALHRIWQHKIHQAETPKKNYYFTSEWLSARLGRSIDRNTPRKVAEWFPGSRTSLSALSPPWSTACNQGYTNVQPRASCVPLSFNFGDSAEERWQMLYKVRRTKIYKYIKKAIWTFVWPREVLNTRLQAGKVCWCGKTTFLQ
jgi:hypothetical protein